MADVDRRRIESAVTELLLAIGEDPGRDGLESTPQRVAEAYAEFFGGVGADPLEHLRETIPTGSPDAVGQLTGETVIVRDIAFRSVCEHHLLPFVGVAHIAYIPGDAVVGLGRLPRVVDTLASRPQVQERLTEQIAGAIDEGLAPRGVLVVLDASHQCVTTRGARQTASSTVTVASRGDLRSGSARSDVIALIGAGVQGRS
ncbi:GTP cyclohydrolase I [Labedella gwakjiensis]|uniref:GTP cyclohydrolase 1 n=1 Tax=Labedella gwakjiensis TaxID=390269 RepID=A0A2P8GSC3_9MICO|nr:GTP cyclohydrolase I FolE [Labedella gwakjiensis]PSL36861.1 GTP cyclohydrolase I [Labedella gwakjiensis]RUQ84360.1 GTP cyclohydrolase I FolE [Labedella gwakjiensis]